MVIRKDAIASLFQCETRVAASLFPSGSKISQQGVKSPSEERCTWTQGAMQTVLLVVSSALRSLR